MECMKQDRKSWVESEKVQISGSLEPSYLGIEPLPSTSLCPDQGTKWCMAACQRSGILAERMTPNECKHRAVNCLIGLRASIRQQLHTPFTSLWNSNINGDLFMCIYCLAWWVVFVRSAWRLVVLSREVFINKQRPLQFWDCLDLMQVCNIARSCFDVVDMWFLSTNGWGL